MTFITQMAKRKRVQCPTALTHYSEKNINYIVKWPKENYAMQYTSACEN